jgi:hypothetical protein
MPKADAGDHGRKAEQHVATIYELEQAHDLPGWVDLVNPRSGARYQVKAATTRPTGKPNVRLWEDQHRSLQACENAGGPPAWYAFVCLSEDGRVLETQRRRPIYVGREVRRLGGWDAAGHETRPADQAKVPVKVFL